MFKGIEGPLVLIVMDGVGESASTAGNAVKGAPTPVLDSLRANHRHVALKAHGTAVGLPSDGDMGNSEVGHNALGAGQVVDQGAKLVADAIASGAVFEGETWKKAVSRVLQQGSVLHFIGLLSDGNVHSHLDHLIAMLGQAAREGVNAVRVHVLLDGRDVGGTTAHRYVAQLESVLADFNRNGRDFRIASGGGRMVVSMDRYEADWAMVSRGWQLQVRGEGAGFASAQQAIQTYRDQQPGVIDQDLPGFVVKQDGQPVGPIRHGDSVILFNFRGDRAIEISQAFDSGPDFDKFDRGPVPDVFYAGMMEYDGDLHCPKNYLVGPPDIANTLTDFLAEERVRQFAISETQKFGHITYFWNGNRSGKVDEATETYVNIPSDTCSFDQRPWMKAAEITDHLIDALRSGKFKFLRVNYANGDMVGHTGNLAASITAMACLDLQLGRLLRVIKEMGGVALITADHGNCDQMFELSKSGEPVLDEKGVPVAKTSHTLNPVPFILFDPHNGVPGTLHKGAQFGLSNVTATALELLGFAPPTLWRPSLLNLSR